MTDYQPEAYWSRVAEEIKKRGPDSYVAGDDEPFYRYKRQKFLTRFLDQIDVESKTVLELGCGPGGNLIELLKKRPAKLIGADVSTAMLALSSHALRGRSTTVELHKINGTTLPFPDRSIDIALTVTVLQHNTDPLMFAGVFKELCRVTKWMLVLHEDTAPRGVTSEDGSFVARPADAYEAECRRHGFDLSRRQYLNTRCSYFWYRATRRFARKDHREGEPVPRLFRMATGPLIWGASLFDDLFPDRAGLTKMVFLRREAPSSEPAIVQRP